MNHEVVSIKTSTHLNSKLTVGVLFGGRSAEHEISLRSALYILKNLPQKYSIVPIGISRAGEFHSLSGSFSAKDFANYMIDDLACIVAGKVPQISSNAKNVKSMFYPAPKNVIPKLDDVIPQQTTAPRIDHGVDRRLQTLRNLNQDVSCVFPVLHGTNGEDGRFQSLFELADIPYVGCDRVASVVGMDKDIQKRLARDAGIDVARYTTVDREEIDRDKTAVYERVEKQVGYPCFVKPNALGSAVGAGKALNRNDLHNKLADALRYDSKALVEELIQGTEIECAFLGTPHAARVTTPGEIATDDFYSYDEKYSASSTARLFVPARLEEHRIDHVKLLAKKIARVLGLEGFARIDFWDVTAKQKFIFNEVNTIPGLTSISMFPKLWEHEGARAEEWIEELVERALQRKATFEV